MRAELPTGTVTFLFTDVEGSTRLLHELGAEAYAEALAEHRRVIREACAAEGGVEVDTQGDAFFFAFPTAPGALAAAAAFTEALSSGPIAVRVGLHTGTPLLTDEGYVGDDVHRAARIAAAGHGGQVLVGTSTAMLVDADLLDLGEHRFKDLAVPERVYQLGDREFPGLKSLYRTNLPVPATPFLGRSAELEEVVDLLLSEETRLLTLTGPGGTGKTRLALQAAAEASEAFPGGIRWVPLAAVSDASLVLPTIAQTLEVAERPGTPLAETLAGVLAGSLTLILLDNLEQLLPDAAIVLAPLLIASGPKLLVTSRERLQLQGERVYSVPALAEDDGVALFTARAEAIGSSFERTESVGELCARLDNLPLALELAAARTALFSPEQLLERLSERLDLLKGLRDADPRQQTLRATIEWSYGLLNGREQELFRALSVFAGGCTYDAAEAVCAADPDTLQSLLDKSLLRRRDSEHGQRFWMLETIRDFAAGELSAEERSAAGAAHTAYFVGAVHELGSDVRGRDPAAWAFMRTEHPNVLAALDRALEERDVDAAQKILVGSWFYWITGGLAAEGDDWAAAVAALPSAPSVQYALSLALAAEFPRFRGDPRRALPLKLRSIEVSAQLDQGDLAVMGNLAADHTDVSDIYARLGELETAAAHARRGLEIRRAIGAPGGIAHALGTVASIAELRGDVDEALSAFRETVALYDAAGDPTEAATPLCNLGNALRRTGNLAEAREALDAAGERLIDSSDNPDLATLHNALGLLAASEGDVATAVELISRAAREIGDLGLAFDNDAETEKTLEECLAELGPEAFRIAREAGEQAARSDAE